MIAILAHRISNRFRQSTDPGALKYSNRSHNAPGNSLSVVSNVESVMGYVRRGVSMSRLRITAPIEPPTQAQLDRIERERASRDPTNWTTGQQIALLLIERSAVALDCIAHMPLSKSDRQRDFAWLRAQGYAARQLGERLHRLTGMGSRAARELIAAVSLQLGLHHVNYNFDSWNEHKARCSCGWHASAARTMNRNWIAPLQSAASRHLADPQEWIRRQEASQRIIDAVGGGQ